MAGQDYTNWGSDIKWQGQTTPGKGGAGALQGAATGAQIGTSIMPGIGTGVGAILGGVGGWLLGRRPKQLSDAEQLAINWDKLKGAGLKEFGGQALGGAWQGIQDYTGAVKDAMAQGVPGLSELYGGIGKAEATAGKLENYKPERIDTTLGEERANLGRIGNRASQATLPVFAQADAQRRMLEGNANLSAAQKALMGGQASRAAAAQAAQAGVGLEEGARGRIADLSKTGDMLAEKALADALAGRVSLTQAYAAASEQGQRAQQYFLSALQQIPGMYEKFLSQFEPNPNQYKAAQAGGRDSGTAQNLSDLANAAGQAWTSYRNGKQGPSASTAATAMQGARNIPSIRF